MSSPFSIKITDEMIMNSALFLIVRLIVLLSMIARAAKMMLRISIAMRRRFIYFNSKAPGMSFIFINARAAEETRAPCDSTGTKNRLKHSVFSSR